MGADKYENEKLIRWGWPEDVWFHVDNLSSAHVYVRLKEGQTIDDIPPELIMDCAQLVKHNSIQGCKESSVDVVYTMWSNLKKTQAMVDGQVGFHDEKAVRKIRVEKKDNSITNRLTKTKTEAHPDFREMREERDRKEREVKREQERLKREREKEEAKRREELKKLKSYDSLMKPEKMTTNADAAGYDSDDFM
ncbi:coiled-coil domain-containing protein 25-like isoform X2 [Varroa jacobsoni]|nr:coiled-coil domain-containing protein 25-like isoform X2 [Varroa destructor]XP_022661030.1 coiled-coil domain-containing protein 25-like isoform X2 [Varroa destructor]XP_022701911.1 coiled-coil domain-containing protein 25-like isoform X2 [Varroa jacobsoni]XP_022701912.1 coiled-coil domain-containing protein 25-like isoform X2 [Varroa jacobsoni]XP_022701914.1 coiled-coil domain-containing protein 25-like isoform X2 [Varroa jacobsoni]